MPDILPLTLLQPFSRNDDVTDDGKQQGKCMIRHTEGVGTTTMTRRNTQLMCCHGIDVFVASTKSGNHFQLWHLSHQSSIPTVGPVCDHRHNSSTKLTDRCLSLGDHGHMMHDVVRAQDLERRGGYRKSDNHLGLGLLRHLIAYSYRLFYQAGAASQAIQECHSV